MSCIPPVVELDEQLSNPALRSEEIGHNVVLKALNI
jgi:hypothetical protein